jgi:1,2-phenylacetyl-CoA epoxidase PaaB subunit
MEKIARERYFRKAEDEDIFVMSEGEIVEAGSKDKATDDEAAN